MTRELRPVFAAAAACLVLLGCTETSEVGLRQGMETAGPTVVGASPSAERLAAQKKAAGIADCPASDRGAPPVPDGLPDVVLACLGGGRDVRLAGLRGTPMLVNVWAQWCGPCRAEAPYLADVAAGADDDLVVLGVDFVDPQPGLAIEFAQLARWRYPQLVDSDKVLAAPLQLVAPPQSLFVRADGTIAYRHVGPFTSAGQIRALAREHLGVDL